MITFTVHLPTKDADRLAEAEGAIFVPEAFSWGAFLFAPLWLLCNRAWLAFLVWCLLAVALAAAFGIAYPAPAMGFLAALLVALFFGFEARQFVRSALERRGYRLIDIVAANDARAAERGFYVRWLEDLPEERTSSPSRGRQAGAADEVIGLFPEAGGRA